MAHQLNWTPGNHGKGIRTPEGEFHTWNIDEMTRDPHHSDYLEEILGLHDVNPYAEHQPFEIGPEGKMYEGPADIDKVDPRLVPTERWRFQAAVNVVDVLHGGPQGHDWEGGGMGSKPVIYDPEKQIAYVGRNGGYHDDLMTELGEDRLPSRFQTARLIPPSSEVSPYTGEHLHEPQQLRWFGKPPENFREVHQALGAEEPPIGGWDWAFKDPRLSGAQDEEILGRDGVLRHLDQMRGDWDVPTPTGDLKIIHGQGQEPPEGQRTYHSPDYPFYYDPASRTMSLGQWGAFHHDLFEERGRVPGTWPGRIGPHGIDWYPNYERPEDGEMGVSHERHFPPDVERVHQELGFDPPTPGWKFQGSTIESMRDGYGRFAKTAPWELGLWGKGVYFPETGTLHTWGDERTHLDALGEDENATQPGAAHHIIIRPNGTVRDQGVFDRDFGPAEGDVEGLHRALRELDPRLRLDSPSEGWDFGSTEPMEEEPSMSRDEHGDVDHGVQTSNDFAGGL